VRAAIPGRPKTCQASRRGAASIADAAAVLFGAAMVAVQLLTAVDVRRVHAGQMSQPGSAGHALLFRLFFYTACVCAHCDRVAFLLFKREAIANIA